jgi:hypothetical protein
MNSEGVATKERKERKGVGTNGENCGPLAHARGFDTNFIYIGVETRNEGGNRRICWGI